MPHLDPDRLTLLGLGERPADASDAGHLASCDACRGEVEALRQVAAVARGTEEVHDLPHPSERVWDRIAAQALGSGAPTSTAPAPASTAPEPTAPPALPVAAAPARRRGVPARVRLLAVAACALAVGVLGTTAATRWIQRDTAQVVARADLVAVSPTPSGAHGTARILRQDGRLEAQVEVSGLGAPGGYLTVWIYDGRQVMVPLGTPGAARLTLPAAASDLDVFRIIDISDQRLGQQVHGTSLLQGELHRVG